MCATSDAMLPREKSRGKQRIDIEYLQNQTARKQTFRKRNRGLFKKAMELAKLCGATVALRVALDEPKGKSYDYYYYSWKPESENLLPMKCSDRATSDSQQQQAVEAAPAAAAAAAAPSMEFCATMNNLMEGAHTVAAAAACDESSSDYSSSSGTNESQEETWYTEIGQKESQVSYKSQEAMDMGPSCLDSNISVLENDQRAAFLDTSSFCIAELDPPDENPDDYLVDEPTNETYWPLWCQDS